MFFVFGCFVSDVFCHLICTIRYLFYMFVCCFHVFQSYSSNLFYIIGGSYFNFSLSLCYLHGCFALYLTVTPPTPPPPVKTTTKTTKRCRCKTSRSSSPGKLMRIFQRGTFILYSCFVSICIITGYVLYDVNAV